MNTKQIVKVLIPGHPLPHTLSMERQIEKVLRWWLRKKKMNPLCFAEMHYIQFWNLLSCGFYLRKYLSIINKDNWVILLVMVTNIILQSKFLKSWWIAILNDLYMDQKLFIKMYFRHRHIVQVASNYNPNCASLNQSLFDFRHSCLGVLLLWENLKLVWRQGNKLLLKSSSFVIISIA